MKLFKKKITKRKLLENAALLALFIICFFMDSEFTLYKIFFFVTLLIMIPIENLYFDLIDKIVDKRTDENPYCRWIIHICITVVEVIIILVLVHFFTPENDDSFASRIFDLVTDIFLLMAGRRIFVSLAVIPIIREERRPIKKKGKSMSVEQIMTILYSEDCIDFLTNFDGKKVRIGASYEDTTEDDTKRLYYINKRNFETAEAFEAALLGLTHQKGTVSVVEIDDMPIKDIRIDKMLEECISNPKYR